MHEIVLSQVQDFSEHGDKTYFHVVDAASHGCHNNHGPAMTITYLHFEAHTFIPKGGKTYFFSLQTEL